MLMVRIEVQTMVRTMSIGCLIVTLTGCVAPTENEAAESGGAALIGNTFELGAGAVAADGLLDGVEVCTMGGDRCTTTEGGTYTLEGLQPNSGLEVSFRKAGYVPAFVQASVNEIYGTAEAGLLSVAEAREFAAAAGAKALGETGGVLVMMTEPGAVMLPPLAGGTFAVHATDRAHSIYADEDGLPDAALKCTSSAGWGAAFGIAPGTVTVEVPGGCGAWSAQAAELVNPVQVQVHAGELSVVTMFCVDTGLYGDGTGVTDAQ